MRRSISCCFLASCFYVMNSPLAAEWLKDSFQFGLTSLSPAAESVLLKAEERQKIGINYKKLPFLRLEG